MAKDTDPIWVDYKDQRGINDRPLGWLQHYDHEFEPKSDKIYLADAIITTIAILSLALIIQNL